MKTYHFERCAWNMKKRRAMGKEKKKSQHSIHACNHSLEDSK